MAEENEAKTRWVDRGWYLATEFGQSRAERYEEAAELAKRLAGYAELLDENLHLVHRNLFRREELDERAWELLNTIRQWQSARAYVKGDELPVESVLGGLRCYVFEKDELGCDPDPKTVPLHFGCPRSGIGLWLTAAHPWFTEARPLGSAFRVPTDRLLDRLRQALESWRVCPNLDLSSAEALLGRLPRTIDVAQDRRWRTKSGRWGGRVSLVPSSPADYYQFLLEHLYAEAGGERSD